MEGNAGCILRLEFNIQIAFTFFCELGRRSQAHGGHMPLCKEGTQREQLGGGVRPGARCEVRC